MYLGAYEFEGDPDALLVAYERLVAGFAPGALTFHVCIRHDEGITVLDACPTHTVFSGFSTSSEFLGAVERSGLPTPRVHGLGEIHATQIAPRHLPA